MREDLVRGWVGLFNASCSGVWPYAPTMAYLTHFTYDGDSRCKLIWLKNHQTVSATPAIHAVRQTYPNSIIDVLLSHHTKAILQYSPHINNLIASDNFRFSCLRDALKPKLFREFFSMLRTVHSQKYDIVLVFHHLTTKLGALKYATISYFSGAKTIIGLDTQDSRSRLLTHSIPDLGFGVRHEIDYWLDMVCLILEGQSLLCQSNQGLTLHEQQSLLCRIKTENRYTELTILLEHEAWAEQQLATMNISSPIIMHPGSGQFSTGRRWSPKKFAHVADVFQEDGYPVIIVGTHADNTQSMITCMKTSPINLTGKTTIHQLTALLKRSALFIGGDSGVCHIAAASSVPMITIFGSTNARAWGYSGEKQILLQAGIPCQPCAYINHTVGLLEGCSAKTCLKLITPDHVINAGKHLLEVCTSPLKERGCGGVCVSEKANILGVYIHAVTFSQTIDIIETFIATEKPHQITTVNPEFVVTAQHDIVFRQIINRSALALPDGIGLLKAAKWLNEPTLPERVAGVDVVKALAKLSAERGYRLYFLGARPGVAEMAMAVLKKRYPNMVAVGAFAGSPSAKDEDMIVAKIQMAKPDIVFVAYGAPRQDKWIARNMHRLSVAVLIGVGGAFDFISGVTTRAPKWMQNYGLEWLHRLMYQPSRWRRIWNAVPKFMWLVYFPTLAKHPQGEGNNMGRRN